MITFTLCSNNYLAHAKTLGDSLLEHNPEIIFIIGLVDERSKEINYSEFDRFEIIDVTNIGISNFNVLCENYNIIELNTSVKATYFKHIFKKFPNERSVLYFDPDIMIFAPIGIFDMYFDEHDILITPHILTPLSLELKNPNENLFLNYGIYNLGFIGITRACTDNGGFLDWWETRLLTKCFIDTCNGYFVDQLWINLIPIYFKKVKILRHLNMNIAPWNLHERKIIQFNGNFNVQSDEQLLFFHFSSYDFSRPNIISKHYDRYTFETHPELRPLYMIYHDCLIKNKIEKLSRISNLLIERRNKFQISDDISKNVKNNFSFFRQLCENLTPPIIWKALRRFYN